MVAVDIEMFKVNVHARYLSSGLMTEDVIVLHDHRAYAPSMPEVHV